MVRAGCIDLRVAFEEAMEKHVGRTSPERTSCRPFVELRDHPSMQYRGMRNWPPVWTQAGTTGNKSARGEIGVLKQVNGDRRSTQRFYLVIEHEGERYVGALLFDDTAFGWFISKVLRSHIGWPIKNIGALDLSFSL